MNRQVARDRVGAFSTHAALTLLPEPQRAWVQSHLEIAGFAKPSRGA